MDEDEENVNGSEEETSLANREQNSLSNEAIKFAEKTVKDNLKNSSMLKAIGPLLIKIGLIVLVVILLIGIVMFLVSMPGMAMEQLKQLFSEAGNAIAAWFGEDTTTQFKDEDTYKTLDYLEEMGYDLKGMGFLTGYVGGTDDGVVRDGDGKIIEAQSDFVATYMMSDNYIYTLKNDNINNGLVGGARILTFLIGPLSNGIINRLGNGWGNGLLAFYEEGAGFGIRGNLYNNNYSFWQLFSTDTGKAIKVDTKKKTISIERSSVLNNNAPLTFEMDGWTGRYGMPLEFLLAVHMATRNARFSI